MSASYSYSFNIDQYRYISEIIHHYYRSTPVTVFEVGSRDAADAYLLGTLLAKGSRIVCFDPHPMFKILAAPFAVSDSLVIENIALSETSGPRGFYMTNTADIAESCDDLGIGASSLKKPYTNVSGLPTTGFQEIVAACERGDEYCARLGVAPDVIILDVQGAEVEVLRSLGARLDDVILIFIECSIRSGITYHDDAAADDIIGYLRSRGFRLLNSYDISRYAADLVFLNSKLHEGGLFREVFAKMKLSLISGLKQILAKAR